MSHEAMTQPRYTHDCDACQFVGHVDRYDVHFCKRCDGGTIIMRYGSDGPQYASAPLFVLDKNPDAEGILRRGLAFARSKGVAT
jgi:hypothetical protein